MSKVYLASSWRNESQPNYVEMLRNAGHEVYDFRHPPTGDHLGFSWADVDLRWTEWDVPKYLAHLDHPIAVAGFQSDKTGMNWADVFVLLLPCGPSAHLEAGWAAGRGKRLIVVMDPFNEKRGADLADLMYRLADAVVTSAGALIRAVTRLPCEGYRNVRGANHFCHLLLAHPGDHVCRCGLAFGPGNENFTGDKMMATRYHFEETHR